MYQSYTAESSSYNQYDLQQQQRKNIFLPRSNFERSLFEEGSVTQVGSNFVTHDVAPEESHYMYLNLDSQFGVPNMKTFSPLVSNLTALEETATINFADPLVAATTSTATITKYTSDIFDDNANNVGAGAWGGWNGSSALTSTGLMDDIAAVADPTTLAVLPMTTASTLKLVAADFQFMLPQVVKSVKSVKLKSVEIPFFHFNVSSYLQNNVICFLQCDTNNKVIKNVNVVIPDGNYMNVQSLVNAINSALFKINSMNNNVLYGFTFLVSPVSLTDNQYCDLYKIEIHYKTDIPTYNSKINGIFNRYVVQFPGQQPGKSLGWLMGFRQQQYTFDLPNYSTVWIQMTESTAKLTPRYYYVTLDEYSSSRKLTGGGMGGILAPISSKYFAHQNILGRVMSANANRMSYNIFAAQESKTKNAAAPVGMDFVVPCTSENGTLISEKREYGKKGVDIRKCRVQILDEYGNVMDFQGIDFSMCLELEIV